MTQPMLGFSAGRPTGSAETLPHQTTSDSTGNTSNSARPSYISIPQFPSIRYVGSCRICRTHHIPHLDVHSWIQAWLKECVGYEGGYVGFGVMMIPKSPRSQIKGFSAQILLIS